MTKYPYGYGSGRCTLDELRQRYAPKMHAEYARRLFAWLESRGGSVGIGSGWRKTPDDASQASRDGHSFHQSQTFRSGFVGCCAVDLVVGVPGAVHRAPTWNEVPRQGSGHPDIAAFGVHCNVDGEPWHMQWTDEAIGGYVLDGWQSWHDAGRFDPSSDFVIDGDTGTDPVVPPTGERPDVANGNYGLYPLDPNKAEVHRGSVSEHVSYLQAVMRNVCELSVEIDDHFGEQTEAAVREMQGWNDLETDGRCGSKTWRVVDTYATQ